MPLESLASGFVSHFFPEIKHQKPCLSTRTCFASSQHALRFNSQVSYDYALLEDDEVSPQVIGIVPGNLSVDVALDVTIHIYFSELILAGTGDIELTSDRDIRLLTFAEEVVLVTQGEQGNRSIQVKPDRPLRPALAYRVRLRRGVVHDLVGNQLEEVELSFRTAGVAESFAVFAPYVPCQRMKV